MTNVGSWFSQVQVPVAVGIALFVLSPIPFVGVGDFSLFDLSLRLICSVSLAAWALYRAIQNYHAAPETFAKAKDQNED